VPLSLGRMRMGCRRVGVHRRMGGWRRRVMRRPRPRRDVPHRRCRAGARDLLALRRLASDGLLARRGGVPSLGGACLGSACLRGARLSGPCLCRMGLSHAITLGVGARCRRLTRRIRPCPRRLLRACARLLRRPSLRRRLTLVTGTGHGTLAASLLCRAALVRRQVERLEAADQEALRAAIPALRRLAENLREETDRP